VNFLRAKAQFYHTLASLVEAGVLTARAFRRRHPLPFRRAAFEIADAIEHGEGDLGALFSHYPRLFSPFECRVVTVGQRSGRLDATFRELGDWFDGLARLRSEIFSRLTYPLVMYHAAVVLIPFVNVILGATTARRALLTAAAWLSIPWVLILFFGSGRPARRSSSALSLFDALLLQLPWIGGLSRRINYARFFRAFALALDAGVRIPESVRLAADTCTNAVLRRRLHRAADVVETEGCSFADAFHDCMGPLGRDDMIETVLDTGEVAGQLVEASQRIGRIYTEQSRQSLERAAVLLPTLLYLGLMLWMAVMVLRFWGQLITITTSPGL